MADKISDEVIDLSNIQDGGSSSFRVPEGDYAFKVKSVTYKTSNSGNPMLVWEHVGTGPKVKGKISKDYTVLKANSYWKLRDLVEAATGKVPGPATTRKLLEWCKKEVVGKPIGITLSDDEYTNDKGKVSISSKPTDYLSVKDIGADSTGPEPEVDDDVEVEEEEGPSEDDLLNLSRAQLKALIKEEGLEVKVTKGMSDDDVRSAISEARPEDEEAEDDEEEEEDAEDEEDEDDGDDLNGLDRTELKARLKTADPAAKVKKSMTDDDLRSLIRAASDSDDDEEEIEDVDLDEL